MTSILPPVATGACRRPSGTGWSRDGSRVSQDRRGWPQIQSRIAEGGVQRGMIGAMHELPDHPLLTGHMRGLVTRRLTGLLAPLCTRK